MFRSFALLKFGEFFLQKTVDVIGKEHDFKEAVGAFLVPEGVWRVSSAMGITWVHVMSVSNIGISLSESR